MESYTKAEISTDTYTNGAFLADVTPLAYASSSLSAAVDEVSAYYLGENRLGFALESLKCRDFKVLTDYWNNDALDGLSEGAEASGFNDTTSGGNPRTLLDYARYTGGQGSDTDPRCRFLGYSLLGFEVSNDDQPVMAVVLLDPTKLDPDLSDMEIDLLVSEVETLRLEATDDNEDVRFGAVSKVSNRLKEILSSCLLSNETFVSSYDHESVVERWDLPFDLIASLKALHPLLTGGQTSAEMRQGAIRLMNEDGQEIIVGCSGLNSAIDEMVARNFGNDILSK